MTMLRKGIHLITIWFFVGLASGQRITNTKESNMGLLPPPAVRNISKLESTLTMDHSVYVPGEIATITFRVRNPTDQVLEVINPFWAESATFELWAKHYPTARTLGIDYGPPPDSIADVLPAAPLEGPPTIQLQPGATVSRTVRSNDLRVGEYVLNGGAVPDRLDSEYRLIYTYDSRVHTDFKVAAPFLERFVTQTLDKDLYIHEDGKAEEITHRVHALVLAIGEQRVILRTIGAWQPRLPRTAVGQKWSDSTAFYPYERIAELNEPVTGLELSASSSGSIELRYADASGRRTTKQIASEERFADTCGRSVRRSSD
jgi:hypothetical protein